MGAGDSAETEAKRAARRGRRFEGRARRAGWTADDWAHGAEGERLTAEELDRLAASGWRVLHDRLAPDGGNVDHIAVGPPGIAVLDTKRWNNPVTVTADRRLVFSRYDRTDELDRLQRLVDHVRGVLARDGVSASVRGYLVLAGDADRERAFQDLGDLRIGGLGRLVGRLDRPNRPKDLDADLIEAIATTLAAELPDAAGAPSTKRASSPAALDRAPTPTDPAGLLAGRAPSALFEKRHRIYFFRRWKKGGHDRLYINDRGGNTLGFTDVNTGAVEVDCGEADRRFVEVLLAAADRTGIKVAPGDVPKVPTQLFGGRLLSRVASLHTCLLVGHEWQAFGKQRMYGTLLDPAVATFDLGWVDLKTGERHPSMDGPLHPDRSAPEVYLEYLLHARPRR